MPAPNVSRVQGKRSAFHMSKYLKVKNKANKTDKKYILSPFTLTNKLSQRPKSQDRVQN